MSADTNPASAPAPSDPANDLNNAINAYNSMEAKKKLDQLQLTQEIAAMLAALASGNVGAAYQDAMMVMSDATQVQGDSVGVLSEQMNCGSALQEFETQMEKDADAISNGTASPAQAQQYVDDLRYTARLMENVIKDPAKYPWMDTQTAQNILSAVDSIASTFGMSSPFDPNFTGDLVDTDISAWTQNPNGVFSNGQTGQQLLSQLTSSGYNPWTNALSGQSSTLQAEVQFAASTNNTWMQTVATCMTQNTQQEQAINQAMLSSG